MDGFNRFCPFRVNQTSSLYRCECIACQNRSNGSVFVIYNRTLTGDELARLNALKNRDENYGVGNWC